MSCRFEDEILGVVGFLSGALDLLRRGEHGLRAAEHLLEFLDALATGGGVGLVDDDREVLTGDLLALTLGGFLGCGSHDDRELLQGGNDDVCTMTLQGFLELAGVLVDAHDGAGSVVESGNRGLQLCVEHSAIGDDDDLVEDRFVSFATQVRELIGGPRNGVGLARTSRVLDETVDTGPVTPGGVDDGTHRMPLMEPGEQGDSLLGLLVLVGVDEIAQDVEPGVALPHLLPQIRGLVAVDWRWWVARSSWMTGTRAALIEGEEPGLLPGEPGGHGHVVRVDGEMHERAAGEDQVGRVAIGAVLLARSRRPAR